MSHERRVKFPRLAALCTIASLVLPCVASAQVAAGFAPGSLWISKTELAAGDAATLYTVAYNSTAQTVAGDAVFSVDGTTLGTKHFSLAAGTTQILSQAWTATEGSHRFGVGLENLNAGSAVLAEAKSETLTIVVAPPPPPSAAAAAAAQATNGISAAAPVALEAASSTLGTVQSARAAAIASVENALAASVADATVLGTSTEKVAPPSEESWKTLTHPGAFGSYLSSAWRTALGWALFVLKNDWLFWIALVLVLYIVLRLLLLMFRERRNRRE